MWWSPYNDNDNITCAMWIMDMFMCFVNDQLEVRSDIILEALYHVGDNCPSITLMKGGV